jgi:site-specific recombinase XerD
LTQNTDVRWLSEIDRKLALVVVPRSKFDRLVFTQRLVEAGLTLVIEGEKHAKSDFQRAKGIRNGLMIAILALFQRRLKNFAALEIGQTFKEVDGNWWISLPGHSTKTKRWDERRIPKFLNHAIGLYLNQARPMLRQSSTPDNSLWISSRTGSRFTYKNLGTLISKITFQTLGVDVSPHLFRTAGATTAAMFAPDTPHLASALLGHADPRTTDAHYKRTTSINAGKIYGALIQKYRTR